MLQAPTNQDLGRGPTVPRCDLRNDRMIESMTAGQGAVCFELDLLAHAEFERVLLIQEGMELDLVHGGRSRCPAEQFFQVADREVAHPDRPRESLLTVLEERLARALSHTQHGAGDEVTDKVMPPVLERAVLQPLHSV